MTETLLNQIDRLNKYLHLESDINKKDFKYIDTMLQSMRNEAINYTRCCKSDSEQLCLMCKCKEAKKEQLCNSCWGDVNA